MIPIIIGGTGRSGTTVLKRLIAKHEQVASIPKEMRIVVDPGGLLELFSSLTDNWSPYTGDRAIYRLRKVLRQVESTGFVRKGITYILQRMGLSAPSYFRLGIGSYFGVPFYSEQVDRLLQDLTTGVSRNVWVGSPSMQWPARLYETGPWERQELARRLERFCVELFTHVALPREATHFVEDTPYNLVHAHQLLELFPNMKMVHIYRDFRDVLASYLQQEWGRGDLSTIARRLVAILRRWREVKKHIPEDQLLEISLEEIVADRAEFRYRLLEFARLGESLGFDRGLDALDPARMHGQRWKRELSDRQVEEILPILSEALQEYDYEIG